jgi:pimeloyl-ACP methyl ester carboxylesterase
MTALGVGRSGSYETYDEHLRYAAAAAGLAVTEVVPPVGDHVVVDGLRLHYLDWPGPDELPVVFLHGGGLNAHTWDVVALALRDEHRCLAVDLRGHGDSEWSPNLEYTVAAHHRDVLGLLDRLGLERVALVGMSLGGVVSWSIAVDKPERVGALVLVDVGPPPQSDGVARIQAMMRDAPSFPSLENAIDQTVQARPGRDARLLAWSVQQNVMRSRDGSYTWKYDRRPRATTDYVDAVIAENRRLAGRLGDLRVPLLVAYGERSDVIVAGEAERFARSARNCRVVRIPGAGHSVQGGNPKQLVRELRTFLSAQQLT